MGGGDTKSFSMPKRPTSLQLSNPGGIGAKVPSSEDVQLPEPSKDFAAWLLAREKQLS
jgi:hypothetical protein